MAAIRRGGEGGGSVGGSSHDVINDSVVAKADWESSVISGTIKLEESWWNWKVRTQITFTDQFPCTFETSPVGVFVWLQNQRYV